MRTKTACLGLACLLHPPAFRPFALEGDDEDKVDWTDWRCRYDVSARRLRSACGVPADHTQDALAGTHNRQKIETDLLVLHISLPDRTFSCYLAVTNAWRTPRPRTVHLLTRTLKSSDGHRSLAHGALLVGCSISCWQFVTGRPACKAFASGHRHQNKKRTSGIPC